VPRRRLRHRADPGIVKHHLPRMRPVGLAQAAIQLQDVGDVLADFVAGAVTADDEVFRLGLAVGVGGVVHGMRLGVMLPGRV